MVSRQLQRLMARPWHASMTDFLLHGAMMVDSGTTVWHPLMHPKEGRLHLRNLRTAQVLPDSGSA